MPCRFLFCLKALLSPLPTNRLTLMITADAGLAKEYQHPIIKQALERAPEGRPMLTLLPWQPDEAE
jgi:hypothetical protein